MSNLFYQAEQELARMQAERRTNHVATTNVVDHSMDFLAELKNISDTNALLAHPADILFLRKRALDTYREDADRGDAAWKKQTTDGIRALDWLLEKAMAQPGVDLTELYAAQRLFQQRGETNFPAILNTRTNAPNTNAP